MFIILTLIILGSSKFDINKKHIFRVFRSFSAFLSAKGSPGCYFLFLGYNDEYTLKTCDYYIQFYFLNIYISFKTNIQSSCLQEAPSWAFLKMADTSAKGHWAVISYNGIWGIMVIQGHFPYPLHRNQNVIALTFSIFLSFFKSHKIPQSLIKVGWLKNHKTLPTGYKHFK